MKRENQNKIRKILESVENNEQSENYAIEDKDVFEMCSKISKTTKIMVDCLEKQGFSREESLIMGEEFIIAILYGELPV